MFRIALCRFFFFATACSLNFVQIFGPLYPYLHPHPRTRISAPHPAPNKAHASTRLQPYPAPLLFYDFSAPHAIRPSSPRLTLEISFLVPPTDLECLSFNFLAFLKISSVPSSLEVVMMVNNYRGVSLFSPTIGITSGNSHMGMIPRNDASVLWRFYLETIGALTWRFFGMILE